MLPLQQFTDYISQHQLFEKNNHVLLAVSGGKDSVLMAQLFKLAGFNFSIAHCNFNLRANEAQRDEAFVKLLAEGFGVPFHIVHFDTKAFAEQHHISTQMAARQLRYNWFEELRVKHNYQYVAVAHHQNDAIETVLLNLVRGTGISGMHGILPKRGHLIRPLLFLSRQEIDDIVASNNFSFVEDSSNQSSKYARNKIRLNVIPHLREINPKLEETFAENIHRFAETEILLQRVVAETRKKIFREEQGNVTIDIGAIMNLQPRKLLLFELLKPLNFTAAVVDEILNALGKQSGTSFYSRSHRLTIDRARLIISLTAEQEQELSYLHGEGSLRLPNGLLTLSVSENLNFKSDKNFAYLDANLLIFPLVLRSRQPGDRFKPLGMKSFKKLSDFFVDEKVPLPQKDKVPLLLNGNGDLLWVVGMRQDERYKVSATTKKVAIFELSNL
ncbi:tRNA lysidine(34) synthetase TilS [Pedobacter sp. SL55]|uniref:tRNA lysidine(34) synthetase TilS n=1 Tax=Pedobacter sp. SL55 TaxID=2995161 RepID=UPI00226EBDF8|nr:tRNA lysidine(34) synthetase TilS [Pedobacter sp. SL55]WAC42356.1 tRNA lysidine(34) synthetase TilS [Pedobacter sp. SL55]